MNKTVRVAVVTGLWTTAGAFGITGTVYDNTDLRFWGLMVTLVACIVTGHLVAVCAVYRERIRIEHLLEGLIEAARQRGEEETVDRIH